VVRELLAVGDATSDGRRHREERVEFAERDVAGWDGSPVPEPVRDGEVGAEVCTECVVEQRVPRALKEGLPVERFFRPTDDRIQRTVERASPRSNPGSASKKGARTASTVSAASASGSGVCSPSSVRQ